MRVAIAGAGNVGQFIANDLAENGHDVLILEQDPAVVSRCAPSLSGPRGDGGRLEWRTVDACEVSSLREAELDQVDVVVAATGDDEDNLVISLLAKQEFAVPRVVARVNHPKNEWLFNETWGVDVAVSTPHLILATSVQTPTGRGACQPPVRAGAPHPWSAPSVLSRGSLGAGSLGAPRAAISGSLARCVTVRGSPRGVRSVIDPRRGPHLWAATSPAEGRSHGASRVLDSGTAPWYYDRGTLRPAFVTRGLRSEGDPTEPGGDYHVRARPTRRLGCGCGVGCGRLR